MSVSDLNSTPSSLRGGRTLTALEGVGHRLHSTADGLLGRLEVRLAGILSIVGIATDGVGCLLSGGLGIL